MTILISGPGVGLNVPSFLYPSELYNAPIDSPTNELTLAPGDTLPIPAGRWLVDLGPYSVIQYLDPVTGAWLIQKSARNQPQVIVSDGFTRRIANLTGCPVAAIVPNGGSGYVQASTSVVPTVGNSTWQAIVGGAVSVTSLSVAGAGYGIAPLVLIAAPPPPNSNTGAVGGVQATAYAVINAGGTVTGVTMTNVGAGYTTVPAVTIVPSPNDPNFASITPATVVLGTYGTGSITAVYCTNSGAPLATISTLTLTPSGAGTGATITPVVMQTVASTSIVAGGVGMGTASQPALITSAGGLPTTAAVLTNPAINLTNYVPRPYQAVGTSNAGGTITAVTVTDGGLFAGTPVAAIAPGAGGQTSLTMASITFTMGSANDTVRLQSL